MKKLVVIALLCLVSGGCASMYSPYDLRTWCLWMGSTRLTSVGPKAHDPATCQKEFEEDLADRTPRILYVPQDILMWPVTGARATWILLGMTEPPF